MTNNQEDQDFNKEKLITFYCDLELVELGNLEKSLLEYIQPEAKYIIAHETSLIKKKSHFHFIVEMEPKEYIKFRDNIIRKKYKLKGKQYGKVNRIEEHNKMISYCIKDEGDKKTNISDQLYQEYLAKSFKKSDDRGHIEICIDKIAPMKLQYEYTDDELMWYKIKILEYFQKEKIDVGYKKIDRIFEMYVNRQYQLPATTIYTILRQNFKNRI